MWTNKSVFYQIYPMGAFNCPFENDFKQEHRINQVKNWMDDLEKLGIDAVLFNPVFQSHTHGYDTIDFKMLDMRLGTNEDFISVIDEFHRRGIKVVLDAVFNHVGRGFFAFQDVLKYRENSMYKDWFYIDFWGNNNYDDHLSYQNWEGNNNLVKLNLQNQNVVSFLMDVMDFWMDVLHVDGLRLDVAYSLDRNFLKTVRWHAKSKNPEFFLLGETLHGDYNMWVNNEMLDSCTNYECYKGLYSALNSFNMFEILHSLHRQFGKDPWCLYRGKMLLNFVDNHDVVRIASQLQDKHHLPLIYGILMTMPGIPCIYYGSEWGIEGRKNWNDTELRPHVEKLQRNALTEWISKLIQIKHEHSALQNASYAQVALNNKHAIFERNSDSERLWSCVNISSDPVDIHVNYQGKGIDLMTGKEVDIDNSVKMDGYSFKLIQLK